MTFRLWRYFFCNGGYMWSDKDNGSPPLHALIEPLYPLMATLAPCPKHCLCCSQHTRDHKNTKNTRKHTKVHDKTRNLKRTTQQKQTNIMAKLAPCPKHQRPQKHNENTQTHRIQKKNTENARKKWAPGSLF